jgi:hypothetical protein
VGSVQHVSPCCEKDSETYFTPALGFWTLYRSQWH